MPQNAALSSPRPLRLEILRKVIPATFKFSSKVKNLTFENRSPGVGRRKGRLSRGRAPSHAREDCGESPHRVVWMAGQQKFARVRCTSVVWVLLLCLSTRAGAGIGNAVPATRGRETGIRKETDRAPPVRKWGSLLGIPGGVSGAGREGTAQDPAESVRARIEGFGGRLGAWGRTGFAERERLRGGDWSSDDADAKRRTYAPTLKPLVELTTHIPNV